MDYRNGNALVSTKWLSENIDNPRLTIIDATYYLPVEDKNALDEYEKKHIPSAFFFALDDICDQTKPYPHMVPEKETFVNFLNQIGATLDDHFIIYDDRFGGCASARVWWLFKYFGIENVSLLNGGLKNWVKEGHEVQSGPMRNNPNSAILIEPVQIQINSAFYRNLNDVLNNLTSTKEQVIDARNADRFAGIVQEPWPVVKTGRIPKSYNLDWMHCINLSGDGLYKSADELKNLFEKSGIDFSLPFIASCGSGVTASVLFFSAYLIGKTDISVYDGSWAEWGAREDTPYECDKK